MARPRPWRPARSRRPRCRPVAGAGGGTGAGAGGSGGAGGTGTDTSAIKLPGSQGNATPGTSTPTLPSTDVSSVLDSVSGQVGQLTQDAGAPASGAGGSAASSQPSKAGVAISGAVAVNMVSDFAQAYVNAAGMVIKIGGDASITALNNTHALALSGSAALAQSDTAKSNPAPR
ncbi:hypothetical protein G6F57_019815 [Rhizopus arrhizus]|nr:hypothetical protein G6F57_019815 [Rhizopus arrhizus]